MSKENGFLEKLPELMQQLSEVKSEDCEPFDGTFQVDGVPFEIRLKPNATIEDLQRIANYSKEKRNKTQLNNSTNKQLNKSTMNISYLHGFGSSGQSSTVEYLKKSLPSK